MAERLHIALITERFGRKFGGAEAYAVNLFEVLSRDHDVTVIAKEFDHDLPVRQRRVPSINAWPQWVKALHFAHQSKKLLTTGESFDIVHTHAMGTAGDVHVFHVAPIKFRRFILQSRWRAWLSCLEPRNLAYLWLEARSVSSGLSRRVVAVSPSVESQLRAAYPECRSIEMIPPGARALKIQSDLRVQLRNQFGWTSEDVACLLVARNPLRKGFAATLEALERLPAHFKLVVVGADQDARNYLNKQHPALTERIRLIDPVSDVSPFYQCADIYVHPTLRDSFGMAPLEAMAHGLPVVLSASQYCGFAAFVHHKQDAWVLDDPNDGQALADALLALDSSQGLRQTLIEQSAHLVQAFSWEKIAQRYVSLYREVLTERSPDHNQPRTQ